jgi:catechol 2,3-dioxygenase
LARSLEYYEQVIGLARLHASASEAALGPPGAPTVLLSLNERRDARPIGRHTRLGLYHFAILLPDRPSLGRFLAHLANMGVHAATADHGVSEAVYLWDPDGLGIEVYADRPRHEWRHRGNELYMTTEPLDIGALARTAGSHAWTGMPKGTTMGHVHLHVGSIPEAEAFYHRAVGLDKTVWSFPGALFMSAGGYHHHLGVNTWAAGAPPATERDAGLLEWTVILPDDADVESVAARVKAESHEARRTGDCWRLTDPWGTILCVKCG